MKKSPHYVAGSSTHLRFVADFLQAKCDFTPKTAFLRVWGAMHDDHLGLIISVNWTFFR